MKKTAMTKTTNEFGINFVHWIFRFENILYSYSEYKMSTSSSVVSILFIMSVLVIIDTIYISITRKWYENQIVTIQRVAMNIKPIGAFVCYLFLVFGLWHFVLSPSARSGKKMEEIISNAFLLGLIVYGVYASTSYALLKKWSPNLAMADTIWGGSLFGLTAFVFLYLKL